MPPSPANRLIVQIQGFARTPVECMDGLGGAADVLPFKDGGDVSVRMQPGRVTWDSITLRRTQFGPPVLWKWWQQTVDGKGRRREVRVRLVDPRGVVLARWTLRDCWPSRWHLVHTVGAREQSGYVEEVTLVVEDIDLG